MAYLECDECHEHLEPTEDGLGAHQKKANHARFTLRHEPGEGNPLRCGSCDLRAEDLYEAQQHGLLTGHNAWRDA